MAAAAAIIAWSPAPAEARDAGAVRVDIPATSLPNALAELSREAGVSIGTGDALPNRRTRPVKGKMSVEAALARLLSGSGYVARKVGTTAWRIEPAPATRPVVRDPQPVAVAAIVEGEPIIVTANKRRSRLLELPLAVSVANIGPGEAIRSDPTSATAAVASQIDGLTLTALGSGRNRMFLRGVADSPFNGESQTTVAVVFDDARVTYAAPDPDIALVDVERVEVLKGPQGALYGTGALGGIYHVVSRRAELGESSLELTGGGEIAAGGGAGYSASLVANLPLAEDRLGLRLVGYSRKRPGWIDTGSRKNSNAQKIFGARAGIGWDAGGGWRLDLTGFAQWLGADDSQYVYAPGERFRPAQFAEPHDNDLRHASIRLARENGGTDIVLSSGITWHEVDDTYDATIGAGSFGLPDPQTLDAARNYRVWDSEARMSGKAGSLGWLAGFSALQAHQRSDWILEGIGRSLVADSDRRNTTDLALFGNLTLPFGRFAIDAGARLFHSQVSQVRSVVAGAGMRELKRTGVTPSLGLSWRPNDGQIAFIRYGSAIRQGGLSTDSTGRPGPIEGDELATIEAGWRQEFANGGRLDLGAYFTSWENMQSDMLQPNGLFAVRDAGKAQIHGVEAALTLPVGLDWDISLGGTLQHARLVRNDLGLELDDRRLPVIPDYVVRGAVERRFSLGGRRGSLRLKLRYVGPARLSFDPAIDHPMGNYLESGLEGRIDFGRFDLVLALDNLFANDANQFAFGNPLRFAGSRQYTPQPPFNAMLTLHTSL